LLANKNGINQYKLMTRDIKRIIDF